MIEFAVGDLVRCTNADGKGALRNGVLYRVTRTGIADAKIAVDAHGDDEFWADRFELVEGRRCPCGKHAECMEGCALMNYPGYIVDWNPLATPQLKAQQDLMPRKLIEQQQEAEKSDVFSPYYGLENYEVDVEDDGFRTVHPNVDWLDERITVPNSPSLPDVTRGIRVTQVPLEEVRGTDWLAADTAVFEKLATDILAEDYAPVNELVTEAEEYVRATDPLMAGAGDGNSPPWTENKFLDTPEKRASFVEGIYRGGRIADAEHAMKERTHLDQILEERGGRYGAFAHNASIAQQLKLTFRRHPFAAWDGLAEDQQEALDQIAAKISRLLVGDPTYVDNWDDIAGYAKLVAERLRSVR